MEVRLHALLTSALHVGEWSSSRRGRFTPEEIGHVTCWIGDFLGLRSGLDALAKRKLLARAGNPRAVFRPVA